jgi:hypothetical protein
MDRISLNANIADAVFSMVIGRRALAIRGKTEEGWDALDDGQQQLISIFKEVIDTGDVSSMLDAMFLLTVQELAQNDALEKVARTSARTALEKFADAFLALEAVKSGSYDTADKAIPHSKNYRHQGLPRDAFHIACDSDRLRILKGLTEFGHSEAMLKVADVRTQLVDAAQAEYCNLQKKALGIDETPQ